MNIPDKPTFTAAYKAAPAYVQDFINSDELGTAFDAMRETHKLHLDQAGTLADLLNMVILELLPLGGFEAALKEKLTGLDADTLVRLTRDANEKIFAVLRERAKAPPPMPEPKAPPIPPAIPPVVQPVPATKLAIPTAETPQEVTVPMPTPSQKPTTEYRTDPYREPVE